MVVDLCDYRALLDEPGAAYDAVVSVEMIEAVGAEFWPEYFRTLDHVLVPGGKVALQAITLPHDRMLATRSTHTFITKYIFPGGALPSVRAIEEVTARHTALRVSDDLAIGQHYATTLRLWDEAFVAAAEEVTALGFDETFARMWHFYLEYCRAGFTAGYIDDHQPDADQGEPMTAPTTAVAETLAEALRPFIGGDLPVRLVAWDGSYAGPEGAPVVEPALPRRAAAAAVAPRRAWAPPRPT
ncbi:class I SAM-dependent methyltransferase [Nocardioides convexus]|uniref:class I SAM-dependent methyltransferase n=1 Tax=Nocardioides convexus TaxID=2712224 RepID=UPI00241878FE|nr:class I SAM-dependent methyltransferase [Nocardioides convexus]